MARRELLCNIGELKLGQGDDLLRATLGSCVGIGIYWRARNRCALAHCLLAIAPPASVGMTAKYVTHAIPGLLRMLKAAPEHYGELEAVVVGGASMMPNGTDPTKGIGHQNGEAALKCLKSLGIRIVRLEIGGESGRQVSIECGTGECAVRVFEKNAAA